VTGWELREDEQKRLRLRRQLVAKNFAAGLELCQRVGELAEAEGHHPDIHLTVSGWQQVQNGRHIICCYATAHSAAHHEFDMSEKVTQPVGVMQFSIVGCVLSLGGPLPSLPAVKRDHSSAGWLQM